MNKKATTLIELIVSITIAMLLMGAIGVFVSSGMQNLFLQQNSLSNLSDIANFSNDLRKTINYANSSSEIEKVNSGVVFKRKKEFDRGGFSYIGTSLENRFFCDENESEYTKTKHIFIKNFIPFFENGETNISDTLTAKNGDYISYQKEHKIERNGNIIIGKGVFGDKFVEGANGTGIYLNNPTGITTDNEGKLYISDTLNNRILYFSENKIYKLLDFDDSIREPTGLFYDDEEKALYISNSAAGEILKLSSKKYSVGEVLNLKINFSGKNINEISKMRLNFLNTLGTTSLKLPKNTSSINFSGINKNEDFLTGSTNKLDYYFNNYDNILKSVEIYDCPFNGNFTEKEAYLDTDGKVKKQIKECNSGAGTGKLVTYGSKNDISLNEGTNYEINISDIEINSETKSGNHYVELIFFDKNSNEVYKKKLAFFTNGDNKIYTMSDNTLEISKNNLKYPNGIWGKNNFNEFKDYNNYEYKIDRENDIILKIPIKNLSISNNSSLLNIILKYYRNYNCFNLGENEGKVKTFLLKKNLK